MPPARAAEPVNATAASSPGCPEELAATIRQFLADHPAATVLEDGKIAFDLASAQHIVSTEGNRCTLQLWSGERNLVRTVIAAEPRRNALRLSTQRFGHPGTRLLQLRADAQPRSPSAREPARKGYQRLLERALARKFADWQLDAFRTAMDLERSFGPAYARGSLIHGREAWAVIGTGAAESQAILDGILTFGILWLHSCRERGDGRRLYKGLRIVLPRGAGALTQARLPWLNAAAGQWQLWELDEATEELTELDPADGGNLRTRLIHLPDQKAARERFAPAITQVMDLLPGGEEHRVEQRLRSPTELAFLLHGLEFARIRLIHQPGSFRQLLEITCGQGPAQTSLTATTATLIREHIAELFERRNAAAVASSRTLRPQSPTRGIGAFTGRAAHGRSTGFAASEKDNGTSLSRLEERERRLQAGNDPLFRAAPERWLESMLRENLAPLTRSLAAAVSPGPAPALEAFANDPDPDTRGNRAEPARTSPDEIPPARERVIPRFNPRHVYTQVPAIAGASDRGMLDLLGVTTDGRLAVIELKASDDIQMPLQGLDYWTRVWRHQRQSADPSGNSNAGNDLQRHGYFADVALSSLPPRLYLVAPALGIHPATETVLRYLSPAVEWNLIALDERWRQNIRVVWRKNGGRTQGS